MEATTYSWLEELRREIETRHLLTHPFYEKWSQGALTRESLQGYAREYYRLVEAFPDLVRAVGEKSPDGETGQKIAENLREEEEHPELWLEFGEALGLDREELLASEPLPETGEAVESLRQIARGGSFAEGVAALWTYESQVPAVSEKKIEGLRSFYGVSDARGLEYFTVHSAVDLKHAAVEREILETTVGTAEQVERVRSSVAKTLDALWKILDGVLRAYVPQTVSE